MVLNSLLHGTCDSEGCCECEGEGCVSCEGYIPHYGLTDPIILITGHSHGAAIANLTAAYLYESYSQQGSIPQASPAVYAYTFATPNTVNTQAAGSTAIAYTNILMFGMIMRI